MSIQFTDRAGNPLNHNPFECSPGCYQTHDMPGSEAPPYTGYARVLAWTAARPVAEWDFKRQPRFLQIAEHTDVQQGINTLDRVKDEFRAEWPMLQAELPRLIYTNDALGKPNLYECGGYLCSPANFRYLYHACLVLNRLRELKHSYASVHIVEIGGGYGALAYYTMTLAPYFDQKPASYTIIDLPEACAVQAQYARHLGFPLKTVDGTNSFTLNAALLPLDTLPRFLVSAYAFAEFTDEIQQMYAERIVKHCEHGFVVWNYATGWPHRGPNPIYDFTGRPADIQPERPAGIGGLNYFVWF